MRITCPGKCIIAGEHASVYGYPAIATTIGFFVNAVVTPLSDPIIRITFNDASSTFTWDQAFDLYKKGEEAWHLFETTKSMDALRTIITSPETLLCNALAEVCKPSTTGIPTQGIVLNITNTIPLGRGFGSSAALAAVAVTAGLSIFEQPISRQSIEILTQHCEKKIHGKPSGVDAATVVNGGMTYFEAGAFSPIQDTKNLLQEFIFVDAGSPLQTTGDLVQAVRMMHDSQPDAVAGYFQGIGSCVNATRKALGTGDNVLLQHALMLNEAFLERLPIVAEDVKEFCAEVRYQGGGAKVSGAGGTTVGHGGAILVMGVPQENIEALCVKYSFSIVKHSGFCCEGVTYDFSNH